MREMELQKLADAFHQLDRTAVAALKAGDYPLAFRAYEESLKGEQELHFDLQSARTMINLASTLMLMERDEEALTYVRTAKELFDCKGSQDERLHSRMLEADIYIRQGQAEKAEPVLNDAARFCRTNRMRGILELNRAALYQKQGDPARSGTAIQRGVQYLESTGDPQDLKLALTRRIEYYQRCGQLRAAALDQARLTALQSEL